MSIFSVCADMEIAKASDVAVVTEITQAFLVVFAVVVFFVVVVVVIVVVK